MNEQLETDLYVEPVMVRLVEFLFFSGFEVCDTYAGDDKDDPVPAVVMTVDPVLLSVECDRLKTCLFDLGVELGGVDAEPGEPSMTGNYDPVTGQAWIVLADMTDAHLPRVVGDA